MNGEANTVSVSILGTDYLVACPASERDALRESALLVDRKMQDIKAGGKIVSLDRIAVMAALNLAHDLLREQGQSASLDRTIANRVRQLQDKVDQTLSGA